VEDDDEDSVDEEFQHEEEFEDHFQCSVDWNYPPIYEIDVNDEDLVEVSSLSYDQEVDKIGIHIMRLTKVQRVSYISWVVRKLVMLIF
jgi:hypothetical protein